MLYAFGGALALGLAFVVAMNPYGNLPQLLFKRHVIMDSDQRFQYPSIIRSGEFDSAVIGTSSARLLQPQQLNAIFGGHFANLAINDSRAWEQTQVMSLFLRQVARPRTIVFGLDWVWCSADAGINRTRGNEFPEWLYEDNRWVDWQYALNGRALEISFRKLGYHLGYGKPRFPPDGYEVFVPPDETFDAAKARQKIWNGPPRIIAPIIPDESATAEERAAWQFPALAWLQELAARVPAGTRKVFLFVPAHIAALPIPGSKEAARIEACKQQVTAIANRFDIPVVDFRFPSALTGRDENFWDPLHYRVPVATQIVETLGTAVIDGRHNDPSDTWRRLDTVRKSQ